jgi:ADP-ribosylglycohydrolase
MTLKEEVTLYQQLRFEQNNRPKEDISSFSDEELKSLLSTLKKEKDSLDEPNDLNEIISSSKFNEVYLDINDFEDRLKGAIIGRFAGCLLGVPVEGYSIKEMENIAKLGNTPFPPTEYWHKVDREDWIQYGVDKRGDYILSKINAVFVDDDITYTVLNLLLLDKYGIYYSVKDVGELWLKLLPYACTAEEVALNELKSGKDPQIVANNNPYVEWIGAAIRADAFGYVFAGRPHLAAKVAYNDAYLTHRRNGIYGEMFLAAAISLSFNKHPLEAIKKAIDYIPSSSRLYKDIKWALSYEGRIHDFKEARRLIDERFSGMNSVHTNNNMCVITFVAMIAGNSYTNAISTCVAMGLDNDCTGASIGSMFGAYYSINGIEKKWYECFNNNVHTYLKGYGNVKLTDIISLANKLYKNNL